MQQRNFHLRRMEQFLRHAPAAGNLTGDGIPRPSLTISRQCGTRCSEISRGLVEYLSEIDESATHGWAYFGQALIGKLIEEQKLLCSKPHFRIDCLKFPVSERLVDCLEKPNPPETLFDRCTEMIRKLCHSGNAVIAGRAGNFVTADLPNTFHVRLIGSPESRIAYTRKRYRYSDGEARHVVKQVDESRSRFVKRHADADIADSSSYHMVINTDQISNEKLIRIIGDSLIEWAGEPNLSSSSITPFPQAH